MGVGVCNAHGDHVHTAVHIAHFSSFADLDEVALKYGNALEHGKVALAQPLQQLPRGAVKHAAMAALGTALP